MRSKIFAVLAAATLAGSLVAITAGPATAYSGVTLEVTKKVVSPPQVEATFTVKYSCTSTDGKISESGSKDLRWNQVGNGDFKLQPSTATFDVSFGGQNDTPVTCTISETPVAGATTSVTCDSADEGATCGSGGSATVAVKNGGAPTVAFTLTNDFTPRPAAASATPGQPGFTG